MAGLSRANLLALAACAVAVGGAAWWARISRRRKRWAQYISPERLRELGIDL